MRNGIAIAAAALMLLVLACLPSGGPTVSITAPHNGDAVYHGVITIKAHATDNTGVTKVEFYVDGTLTATDNAGVLDTFRGNWDASSAANGAHALKAKAYNTGGKTGENSISVTLAGGQSIHTSDITSDSIWYPAGNPHIIDADIQVYNNAKLTIMPGCLVKFNSGNELSCGYTDPGAIIAAGKADSTILFTSNAASPAPGDWNKIGMYSNTMPTTQFAYCTFEYGGPTSNSDGEIFISDNKVAKIDHCTIRHSGNYGITFQNNGSNLASFTANTVTSCTKYPVDIYPPNVGILVAGNVLSGNATGFDGVLVEGGTGSGGVIANATWVNLGVPYVLNGDVEVSDASGPVLTIEAGNTIKLTSGTEFYCGYHDPGGIIAVGTASAPIIFTSAVASPNPGDWSDIGLYSNTVATTQFAYCTFEYAGPASNSDGEIFVSNNKVAKIDHCTIRHSGNYGITFQNNGSSLASFTANTVTSCAKYPVDIYPPNVAILAATNALAGNAAGYDGVLVEGGTGSGGVIANATWVNLGVPYVLNGDVEVSDASGPVLTIEAGTTVKVSNGVEFYCGYHDAGAISAVGTAGSPIVITSRLASPAPGSWTDIGFYSQATNQSKLQYCTVEYAGSDANGGDVKISNTSAPVVSNCAINNSGSWGVWLEGTPVPNPALILANNTFSNDPSGNVRIPPAR